MARLRSIPLWRTHAGRGGIALMILGAALFAIGSTLTYSAQVANEQGSTSAMLMLIAGVLSLFGGPLWFNSRTRGRRGAQPDSIGPAIELFRLLSIPVLVVAALPLFAGLRTLHFEFLLSGTTSQEAIGKNAQRELTASEVGLPEWDAYGLCRIALGGLIAGIGVLMAVGPRPKRTPPERMMRHEIIERKLAYFVPTAVVFTVLTMALPLLYGYPKSGMSPMWTRLIFVFDPKDLYGMFWDAIRFPLAITLPSVFLQYGLLRQPDRQLIRRGDFYVDL